MHQKSHSKGAVKTTRTPNNGTTGHGWNIRVVKQLCHSTKANSTGCPRLDPMKLNKVFIRPVTRGPTIKDILPILTIACYMALINASSGYHNLNLDKISCFTTLACHFGRYRFTKLPFRVVLAGEMFQQKIDEIFKDLQDIFGITCDILIVRYDANSSDHKKNLQLVMQICQCENSKLNKNKCHFRCTTVPFRRSKLQKWSTNTPKETVYTDWNTNLW